MSVRAKTIATAAAVERLTWRDISLGEVATPRGSMHLTLGVGSGLSRRAGDAPGIVWAVCDRGPNIKIGTAIDIYGLDHLERLRDAEGAKVMPRPDVGPTICELRVGSADVELLSTLRIQDQEGGPISGLPIGAENAGDMEAAFDLDGGFLGSDPAGADTEAIAAHSDGSFWIADEYGPSLLRVGADGSIIVRWMPKGLASSLRGARYPVRGVLPRIARRRRLNRGFEALALSPDENWLYAIFQSALVSRPEHAEHASAFARIWRINSKTGEVVQQFVYRFDPPESFARDMAAGGADASGLKICEVQSIGPNRLLVLERISHTAKVYAVTCHDEVATAGVHLDPRTKPTIEDMDAIELEQRNIRPVEKQLLFSTDDAPEIDRDLEGMALLSTRELLLVTDNDFGVEGVQTGFWRVRFDGDF